MLFFREIELESKNLEQEQNDTHPSHHGKPELLIHCSGGIGRSGTFLSAFHHYTNFKDTLEGREHTNTGVREENLTQGESSQRAVSLKETVHFMRLQRHPWMVEGMHQYVLAYDIIIRLLGTILNKASR